MSKEVTVILSTDTITPTREDQLDEQKIAWLSSLVHAGVVTVEGLGRLFVRLIPGSGYFLNDGHHRLEVLKRNGINAVTCDVYVREDTDP